MKRTGKSVLYAFHTGWLTSQRKLSPEELIDRLEALEAIQSQIKQIQEKSDEGQKAMALDTTIGFAESTTFAIKKVEAPPAPGTSLLSIAMHDP